MPITNYDQYMPEVLGKGKIALYPEHRADTGAIQAALVFGVAVQYNAADADFVEQYDGTGKFVGVSIADHHSETRLASVDDEVEGAYQAGQAVSFLRKGVIYVEVLEDVVKGDDAVIDDTTGNFRPGDTATVTVSEVVGVFKSSAAANGLAQLEINLP